MALLDRYLAAVGPDLPEKDAPDILAELRDTLLSEMEARAEALGRPLTGEEETEILKRFGHPLVVAGRFHKVQQLIGPGVFPFYLKAMRVVLGLLAAAHLIYGMIVAATSGHWIATAFKMVGSLWESAIFAVGVITLAAAAADYGHADRWLARLWSPRHLPEVELPGGKRRSEAAWEVAFNAVFLLWWQGAIGFPNWIASPTYWFSLGPVFDRLHGLILAAAAVSLAVSVFDLVRIGLPRLSAVANLAVDLLWLVVVALVLAEPPWIEVSPGLGAERVDQVAYWAHTSVMLSLIVWLIIGGVSVIRRVWRLRRLRLSPSAAPA
jgi:hypothetical protein